MFYEENRSPFGQIAPPANPFQPAPDVEIIEDEDLDLFMLLITDIVNSNSQVIALGKDVSLVEKAYGVTLDDNTVLLEGVVSRKKQVVPIMTENA